MPAKRNDNRYKRTVTVGRNPDGSAKRKCVYGKTIKEVDRKVADIQTALRNGTLSSDERVLFKDIAFRWISAAVLPTDLPAAEGCRIPHPCLP